MARWNVREKNGLWKGGRIVSSNGYVLVRVGTAHHLADVRGYAYEHRLVAERKLGRRLVDGEEVHHLDDDKTHNDPSNLEVVTRAAHRQAHRSEASRISRFDGQGRPRRFISGHNLRRSA